MQLMMYLGNDLIEAVPLNLESVPQPGYLGRFKRTLRQRHAVLIQESGLVPEFLVSDIVAAIPDSATKAGEK
mgnify:CR=1 FL=1